MSAPTRTTVLVVDDDDRFRLTTVQVLKHAGYTVVAARGVKPALAAARGCAGGVDLLVTDLAMDAGDGLQLASALGGETPALKVLFMSGYGASALRAAGLERHAFLEKPFTPAALLKAIAGLLARA